MNIFVGNLSRDVTEEDLRQAFSAFGQVSKVTILKDKFSGEPRGFGFVEMPAKAEAQAATSSNCICRSTRVVRIVPMCRSSCSSVVASESMKHKAA